MSKLGFACAVLAIVAVATWAYNVNYETKTTLGRIDDLRNEIAAERERIEVLTVEWAWLNRPERLERLAERYHPALGLGPLAPEHFGIAEAVPFPPPGSDAPADEALRAAAGTEGAEVLAFAPPVTGQPIPRPVAWSTR